VETKVLPEDYWPSASEIGTWKDHVFKLLVGDFDCEHNHEEGFHSFPCTREQLELLKKQIDSALSDPGCTALPQSDPTA
jgi:hypothetical protein